MNKQIQSSDIELLKKAGVQEDDIAHCIKVAEKALEIAGRTGVKLDLKLIAEGALFHDLGKARTSDIEHGLIGAEIGKDMGLPKKVTDIMQKHIRGGLSEEEARELRLPVKDYSLNTLEEKIIVYADRLVDIITDGIVDIGGDEDVAERRFEEILREYPKYGKNYKTMNRYFRYHREIQELIKNKA